MDSLHKPRARALTAGIATTRVTMAVSHVIKASEPLLVDSLACGGPKDAQSVAKNVLGTQKLSHSASASATEHLNQLFRLMPKRWRLEVMDMTTSATILGEPQERYAKPVPAFTQNKIYI